MDTLDRAKHLVQLHNQQIREVHAAVLNGDLRTERNVRCIHVYDGSWHVVGTEDYCG